MKKFWEVITNKWLLKGTTTIILVAIVIACYIGLNWGAEKLKIEDIDLTTKKLYSLSRETKDRLKQLDTDITIQIINFADNKYVIEYAEKYERASDRIKIEQIDDLSTRVDLQTEYNLTSNSKIIIVKNGDREKTIQEEDLYEIDYSTYTQIDTTEEAITNAIMEVTIETKPHIYVLEGKTYNDPERSLAIVANKLIDEANEVDLFDILTEGEIPEDCACLVITTLKQDLLDIERDRILDYINKGGKLFIISSNNILNVGTPNFNQILEQYGITIEYGIILEQDSGKTLYDTPNMILTEASASFMNKVDMKLKLFLLNAGKIQFAESEKLEELGVTYEVIAQTSEKSFVRKDLSVSSKTRTNSDSETGACIVGAHITKKISDEQTSQLIIYSDETFASTSQLILGYQSIYAVYMYNNEDIVLNSISHLTEREDTITIRKTDETESYTVTDKEDAVIKTIIFSMPIFIIIIGIAVWVYRRRRV